MSPDKDKYLCDTFPKIFKDRYTDPVTSAMSWGFEVSDGWFTIINGACQLIQSHITWSRANRNRALRYNRALERAREGDYKGFEHYYRRHSTCVDTLIKEALKRNTMQDVPDACPQVVAVQIKEKFGTLRFYYDGGDKYVAGVVAMAEHMSAVTCEVCGKPGHQTGTGWIKTVCEEHTK